MINTIYIHLRFITKIVSLIGVCFFLGCCNHLPESYMCFEDVENITFTRTVDVSEKDLQNVCTGIEGCSNMFIYDSLLVCAFTGADYYWKIYSLNDNQFKTWLIRKGHGHNEFSSPPSSLTFKCDDKNLYCEFMTNKNHLYRCNLTQSLLLGNDSITDITPNVEMQSCRWMSRLDDSIYYYSDLLLGYNKYNRKLLSGNSFQDISGIETLNDFRVENDINTISYLYSLSPDHQRIAEAMLRLNQINLYSFDGTFKKTLCIGDALMDVNAVDKSGTSMFSRGSMLKCFGGVVSYSDYFVALYHGVSYKDYETSDDKQTCSLMVFDWDGNPILKVNVPFTITSFGISKDGYMYFLRNNTETEQILKYKRLDDLLDS